jgi:tripartite ATP-independent transporter DctP family solute receptor
MNYFRSLVAAAALLLAAAGAAHAQTNIRFAHTLSANDTHHLAALHMAELLKQKTGGKLTMSVHPSGELGSDNGILEGVRLGSIDIAMSGNPFFTQFAPRLNVMDLPYLFRDTVHAHKVVDGPVGSALLADLERNRMKGLAFWEIGFRHITNSKHPIRAPKDLEGIKIRTTPNKAHIQAFRLWGANPSPMAFTELYLALQTGTVDAQENPINNIYANRMYEVQKHLSLTGHAYTASVVAMNLRKFNGFSTEFQKAILESAREAALHQRELNEKQESENLEKIKAAGLQVIEDIDREPFRSAVYEAVSKAYADEHGREIVDQIIAVK